MFSGKKQRDKGVPNDSKVTASGTVVTISGTEKKKFKKVCFQGISYPRHEEVNTEERTHPDDTQRKHDGMTK